VRKDFFYLRIEMKRASKTQSEHRESIKGMGARPSKKAKQSPEKQLTHWIKHSTKVEYVRFQQGSNIRLGY
jgi:DNA recombination-dependent growth factor C